MQERGTRQGLAGSARAARSTGAGVDRSAEKRCREVETWKRRLSFCLSLLCQTAVDGMCTVEKINKTRWFGRLESARAAWRWVRWPAVWVSGQSGKGTKGGGQSIKYNGAAH